MRTHWIIEHQRFVFELGDIMMLKQFINAIATHSKKPIGVSGSGSVIGYNKYKSIAMGLVSVMFVRMYVYNYACRNRCIVYKLTITEVWYLKELISVLAQNKSTQYLKKTVLWQSLLLNVNRNAVLYLIVLGRIAQTIIEVR